MQIGMSRSRMLTGNSEPDEATWFPQKGRVNTVHFRSIYASQYEYWKSQFENLEIPKFNACHCQLGAAVESHGIFWEGEDSKDSLALL